jgi:periplasmic divalent cation tolerance protein
MLTPMDLVPAGSVRVLLATAPPGEAHALARRLVEAHLAACVNVVPGLRSVYRWQGRVHDDPESLLVVKTTSERLPDLARALDEHHPYELPEALVLAPEQGSAAYLAWLAEAVRPPSPPAPPSQG